MKQLTIKRNNVITHGPSQFSTLEELESHLARHEEMGSYGEPETYEVVIEDVTDSVAQAKINAEAQAILDSTDWLIVREMETGIICPEEIKAQRAAARTSIL
jgi:hypothetical protein